MKQIFHIVFFSLICATTVAQDSLDWLEKLTIGGYIKDLQSLSFDKNFSNLVSGNLIHNRTNIKWKPSARVTAVTEIRTRLFWGETVKNTPGFVSLLRNENENLNLQLTWIQNNSMVLHSNMERLYLDYRKEKYNIRIGRQRVNWGVTTTWNPNDIFNSYNFLDFDFEERPGIDGGIFRYVFKNSSNGEIAYAHTGKENGSVAALKFSLNKWNYDFQLISGWYNDRPTFGVGWAGYIKDAGFKGEFQYFLPSQDSIGHLNLSLEGDYMFKNGWYGLFGCLFNLNGIHKPVNNWDSLDLRLSAQNMMPTKWNIIISSAKEFTPLLVANMSVLYAPGTNLLILFPSFQYNMATNLDLSLVWQSFFAQLSEKLESVNQRYFLRFKWSF